MENKADVSSPESLILSECTGHTGLSVRPHFFSFYCRRIRQHVTRDIEVRMASGSFSPAASNCQRPCVSLFRQKSNVRAFVD